ncbi:N-formylglutamate amidohydrolase [Oricola sp.]|uniref:N-formylglutamate amidohydrolase n=1 Tax=Oricola sp. TaxID=1979950 RepID=UPI0025F8791D|nr:N-formylglutamate amidohydrolase [Oricola sp.]MCI5076933.1 N-formylglutamate amidohydrolase [Oricola sp.]
MGVSAHNATVLAPSEEPAAEVINPGGEAPIVLVCEHASAFVPKSMAGLGLREDDRLSHAAWDIGALSVATGLAGLLDAPLVASRVSRLVYDCNRPPEAPDAIPARSELIEAPANANLTEAERRKRIDAVYEPFRALLAETIAGKGPERPAIVTIHSFAPVFFGVSRKVELGLLHDADDRLARAMLDAAPAFTSMKTALNEPYGPQDGVTHTLKQHALPSGLLNVMIEVRNDLVGDVAGAGHVAETLAKIIERALEACAHPVGRGRMGQRHG